MEDLRFYPTLTEEMSLNSEINVHDYQFTYTSEGNKYNLKINGSTTIKLTDDDHNNFWDVESEGLSIDKIVDIAHPDKLKGPNGLACVGATLGICIIWRNVKLTQTGCILPQMDLSKDGTRYHFEYTFKPGTLSGDLRLKLILYIEKPSDDVLDGEEKLMNEAGVSVGELETVSLDFSNMYMDFPVVEYESDKEPLWWVELQDWEDPKGSDLFDKENICLYLNPHYPECPSLKAEEKGIKNFDMLVDILAQTYFLIFKNLNDDSLSSVISGENLAPNSICSVLHEFYENCEDLPLDAADNILLKDLQINIRRMLKEDRE